MSASSVRSRVVLGLVAVAAVVGLGVATRHYWRPSGDTADIPAPPGLTASPYLNTGPNAHYVGIDACRECHKDNHASYLHTAHSRALSDPRPGDEPPDGAFVHARSGRSYRVYRRGDQLRHEEVLRTADGKEMARVDQPVRFRMGSGRFARTYLVEADGFLHESPVTWFASKRKWDISPGYDTPGHWSFERPIQIGCLACHAGRAELEPGTDHKARIVEQVIGCERCHGPGSLHVERHRGGKPPPGDDFTIVNPAKLSRPLLEAVCAACHLNGVAAVHVRGRGPTDFRPGRPLSDFRIDYRSDAGDERMKVVGHFGQLHGSACYQKAATLTCLTCHDPHAARPPADPVAHYRQKCLDCHARQGCTVPEPERRKKDAADNCSTCHMPRGDTEVPHVAFTSHRIGRPKAAAAATPPGRTPALVPIDDAPQLRPLDRQRNLGLAYWQAANESVPPALVPVYQKRAREALEAARAGGLRDGPTAEVLAEVYLAANDLGQAAALAEEALAAADLPAQQRGVALAILAECHQRQGRLVPAAEVLEKLTRLRRLSEDWYRLGSCYLQQYETEKARAALEQALAIRPSRPDVHAALARVYERLDDAKRAADHRAKAEWLAKHANEQ